MYTNVRAQAFIFLFSLSGIAQRLLGSEFIHPGQEKETITLRIRLRSPFSFVTQSAGTRSWVLADCGPKKGKKRSRISLFSPPISLSFIYLYIVGGDKEMRKNASFFLFFLIIVTMPRILNLFYLFSLCWALWTIIKRKKEARERSFLFLALAPQSTTATAVTSGQCLRKSETRSATTYAVSKD